MQKLYNAGLYVRLSVEDTTNAHKFGNPFRQESTSVENQKAILHEYAHLRGWNVVRSYIDDGFAGGSYDRPAFLEMLEDAKAGLIDMILVKDLSRLGRNYIETGRYTDEVFPSLGVRFIALMDDIDSESNADFLPFRSLLNDYYLKDLSRKVKSALRVRAENSGYVGAFAPYGFMKTSEEQKRLAVDDYAAKVVHRIFTMRGQGVSYAKIAAALNCDGILAPQSYGYHRDGKRNPYNKNNVWQKVSVRQLLQNEAYLGHSVKFKKGTMSYKNKRLINKPKDSWVWCKNTHPALVSQEMWDKAHSYSADCWPQLGKAEREKALFSGLLKCEDCGGGFTCTVKKRTRKDGKIVNHRYYSCGLYSYTGRSECSPHSISELRLMEIVRQDIRQNLARINIDERCMLKEIQRRISETSGEEAKHELNRLATRLTELETLGTKLYEDRLNGTIGLDTFKTLSAAAEEERAAKQAECSNLAKIVAAVERQTADVQNRVASMRSFLSLEEVDNETLAALIERIEIGEGIGSEKRQSVRIAYRFAGRMD
ncbi:MAG: recombinase family protein [Oscillospiraceae bacterium]|nr:recombinase family protein [Oscillospiraceae bacterium]